MTEIKLWATQTGTLKATHTVVTTVRSIAFSPDDAKLAFDGSDNDHTTVSVISLSAFEPTKNQSSTSEVSVISRDEQTGSGYLLTVVGCPLDFGMSRRPRTTLGTFVT